MPHLGETLNNHNTAKKNGYFLGHSDNLITLSLSLRRSPIRETVSPIILRAGRPRQYTAFLATMQVLEQRGQDGGIPQGRPDGA